MSIETREIALDADARAIAEALAAGRPADPVAIRRVRERSAAARRATQERLGVQDIGVRIIRELRDAG